MVKEYKRASTQFARLTELKERFCQEYVKTPENQTEAAIRAGYSQSSAHNAASRNMADPRVQNRIAELMQERSTRTKITADSVLKRLVEMVDADVGDILNDDGTIKDVKKWPPVWRRSISAFDIIELGEGVLLKKVKLLDKVKILELIGKHVDVSAFRDRVEVDVNVSLAEKLQAARQRAAKRSGGNE